MRGISSSISSVERNIILLIIILMLIMIMLMIVIMLMIMLMLMMIITIINKNLDKWIHNQLITIIQTKTITIIPITIKITIIS